MGILVDCLDRQFAELHRRSREIIGSAPFDLLYHKPGEAHLLSGGEHVLRSAAVVEQTFGGITTNLWDDPFEWTLPETLSDTNQIRAYLDEVETTRQRGFQFFKSDDDLLKEIMTPSGQTLLLSLLLDTLVQAVHHQSVAQTIFLSFKTVRDK